MQLVDSTGMKVFLVLIVGVIAFIVRYSIEESKQFRESTKHKFDDPELIEDLVDGRDSQGQMADQLIDSLDKPKSVDRK